MWVINEGGVTMTNQVSAILNSIKDVINMFVKFFQDLFTMAK